MKRCEGVKDVKRAAGYERLCVGLLCGAKYRCVRGKAEEELARIGSRRDLRFVEDGGSVNTGRREDQSRVEREETMTGKEGDAGSPRRRLRAGGI
jgi:hypothetical protein